MRRFRRKSVSLSAEQERRALRIAVWLLGLQRKVADWLNRKTSGWSLGLWKAALLGLVLGFGGYCAWLVWQAFD